MRLPSLKEIVLTGLVLVGVSSPVYGARVEYSSKVHSGVISEEERTSPKLEHRFQIIVQKGDNLTEIAEFINQVWKLDYQVTPQGIYEQNKDKIKDPNLIYPDQELRFSCIDSFGYTGIKDIM